MKKNQSIGSVWDRPPQQKSPLKDLTDFLKKNPNFKLKLPKKSKYAPKIDKIIVLLKILESL